MVILGLWLGESVLQWSEIMSLVLILEVTHNLISINNHAHDTWLASGHSGLHLYQDSQSVWGLVQVAVIQILVVADTLACTGALSLLPSVWVHSWAQEPALHILEGVWPLPELLGACQGVQSPPPGLGMLVASLPQAPAAWHPGCLPQRTTSDWSCTLKDPWKCHTLCDMVHWTIRYNSVELWPGPGFSPYLFSRCLRSPWGLQVVRICQGADHAGWEEDPTNLLTCCCATSLKHPWFRVRNSGYQLDGVLIPSIYALTHSLGHLIGSRIVWCVGESFTVAGLVDWVAVDMDVAPFTVTEHCWSFSLFGMVILGLTWGHVAAGVDELQAPHCSSAAPPDHSSKLVELVG